MQFHSQGNGKTLPQTFKQAHRYFSDPGRALDFLIAARWPKGKVTCPHCDGADIHHMVDRRFFCRDCTSRRLFTVRIRTLLEESTAPPGRWLSVFWLMANGEYGISSHELARLLNTTQRAAWLVLHRMRMALEAGVPALSDKRKTRTFYKSTKERRYAEVIMKSPLHWLLRRGRKGESVQAHPKLFADRKVQELPLSEFERFEIFTKNILSVPEEKIEKLHTARSKAGKARWKARQKKRRQTK